MSDKFLNPFESKLAPYQKKLIDEIISNPGGFVYYRTPRMMLMSIIMKELAEYYRNMSRDEYDRMVKGDWSEVDEET